MNEHAMTKSAMIRARVEPELKSEAENVLREIGLSTSELISMTLRQVVMLRGLPFSARIPNAETIAAIREHEADKAAGTAASYASVDELFGALEKGADEGN